QNDIASKILNSLIMTGENLRLSSVKNEISKLQMVELGGRSMIEALLKHLKEL
ncbi:hypothetical protein EK21DRAFT_76486, partial [Setomelanomma holmii]